MAAFIYRGQQNDPSKVFDSETLAMVSSSAAAFTVSSHKVLDLDKATKSDADPSAKSANGNVCNTSGCVLAAAEILKNMDKTVNPCEDFYSFACGGFETRNVIPDDQSSVTTFSLISDEVTEQLRSLIERPTKETDAAEPFKLIKKVRI
ncbi:membrane metallo-endopeptidase-like 1 [Daphnia pulex]|uniref:membrane metallo-endopeptidase-like 1 n=1 Tax=Daphnia pulex TaxID=6669 RepID=UPI001EE0F87F|nr:membrane metallo-endopeptidase-like 1 [Daphnia pulex]